MTESKEDRIRRILNEDLLRLEDIHLCGVAKKHMEGIVAVDPKFKQKVMGFWETMQKTMDEFFDIIAHYSEFGLDNLQRRQR